jgi:hypothetical protein
MRFDRGLKLLDYRINQFFLIILMKDKNNIGLIFLIYEQAMISFFFSFEELTLLDFN